MSYRGGIYTLFTSFHTLVLLVLCAFARPVKGAATSQFQHWYKQYGYVFEAILHNNCSAEYKQYQSGIRDESTIDWMGGGAESSALTQPVIACILSNTGEYIKSQLSTAQVLLGVAPTILAILGPRSDEMSTLFWIGRRPLLFFVLAFGSPSLYFGRAFEYVSPTLFLGDKVNAEKVLTRMEYLPVSGVKRTATSNAIATAVEYALAVAAVANIAVLNYELGSRTVCIIWSSSVLAPMVWGIAGIFNHVLGAVMLRTRIRRIDADETAGTGEDTNFFMAAARNWNWRRFWRDWIVGEFKMTAMHKHVQVEEFAESHAYIVLTWLLSVCIIAHILTGTIFFSSLAFVGPEDALLVVVRYMISVMLCRMVLMYELAGLRDAYALSHPEIMTTSGPAPVSIGFTKKPMSRVATGNDRGDVDSLQQYPSDYGIGTTQPIQETGCYTSLSILRLMLEHAGCKISMQSVADLFLLKMLSDH